MSDALFTCEVKCRNCGEILAKAEHVPENEKLRIIMSSPLVTPSCPKGCMATYSDCNANTDLVWMEEEKKPCTGS